MLILGVYISGSAFATPVEEPAADTTITPLQKIRIDSDGDGAPDMLGDTVRVSGIANTSTGQLHEVYMQIFIQSDSAGLSIFRQDFEEPIVRGDSVVVTGIVQEYFDMTEIKALEYDHHKAKQKLKPVPLEEAIKDKSKYEGMLVGGTGVVVGRGNEHNGKYILVAPSDTSEQSMPIYVSNFHSQYELFDFKSLSKGDEVKVTGILSRYNPGKSETDAYDLFLRTPDDIRSQGLTQNTVTTVVVAGSIILILAAGWIISLRIQVKRKTRQIQQSLEEKNLLLKEIHHRVKNNLAIVSGLIELQMDGSLSNDAQRVLQDSQSRIQSMALVHDKLYRTTSLDAIGMRTYLKELVESLQSTFASNDSNIATEYDIDDICMSIDRAIPCGLLVNELVVNAFKHAFKNQEGTLKIKLKDRGDNYELVVADDGKGLPENFRAKNKSSLGMLLIDTFTSQIGAEMNIDNKNGASFSFVFPAQASQNEQAA